ncbi:MAG: transposase [Pseudomonadota bacterium]|nr:transposase [Pseudomonadota bacterium]
MRRKFFDVHAADCSLVAEQALQRIAKLYAIEQQDAGLDQPQRMLLHEQPALSALAELHTWLLANQHTVADGSGTAKGIDYARNRRTATAALHHIPQPADRQQPGGLPHPSGSHPQEECLFVGSERAGRHAASIHSPFARKL